ncbi:hypothetical protein GCM10022237_08970 [Nocardioides ginsengisoli]|uniref:Uncharacterized protein n=1 Tax=Nocardioides ginsengisoli TaxID=363868 RepID=A0ABW3W1Y6_9ACTN
MPAARRTVKRRRRAGSGVVGPPPRFDFEREQFDTSGPLTTGEWYARESARLKAAHAAYLVADAAWSRHASDVLGVALGWLDVVQAENADEVWPEWSVIPDDVRHLCTPDTPKENPS